MELFETYCAFEREVLANALRRTSSFAKRHLLLETYFGLFGAFSGLLIGFVVGPIAGLAQLETALIIAVATAVVFVVLMCLSIVLFCVVTAPFCMWNERANKLVELEGAFAKKQNKKAVLSAFHKLAERGTALMVADIKDQEFDLWKQRVKEYREYAITMIREHVSRTEAMSFDVTMVTTRQLRGSINSEHNSQRLMLVAQGEKLLAIIKQYEGS